MNTGLDSFTNPSDIGALYPFQGAEVPLFIVGLVAWILWHVLQVRVENRDYGEAKREFERVGLDSVLPVGSGPDAAPSEVGPHAGPEHTGPSRSKQP
jgi:hypothetical protein